MDKETITVIVAIYGAVLSTVAIIWQGVVYIISKRPRIQVKVSYGFLQSQMGVSESMIFLEAINHGERAVTLSGMGFNMPNKKVMHLNPLSDVSFPHELGPLKACKVWAYVSKIAKDISEQGYSGKVKMLPFYRSQTEKKYKGQAIIFNIDEWLNK